MPFPHETAKHAQSIRRKQPAPGCASLLDVAQVSGAPYADRWAIMRTIAASCAALLLASGCLFGDLYGTHRSVSIKFPPPEPPSKVSLSVGGPEIQEILRITESVLTPEGLIRASGPNTPDVNGQIACYHLSPYARLSCEIVLRDDKLSVVFFELKQRQSGEAVKRMCKTLAEKFKSHYGARRVAIET